jgi:hypothetical protein
VLDQRLRGPGWLRVAWQCRWGFTIKIGRTAVSVEGFPFWRFNVSGSRHVVWLVLPGVAVTVEQDPHPDGALLQRSLPHGRWRKDHCWREKEGEPQYQAPGVDP